MPAEGRFVLHQDLPTLLRCHIAAFEALGGVPQQILYDRMKTAVIREDAEAGHIVYNRTLFDFARQLVLSQLVHPDRKRKRSQHRGVERTPRLSHRTFSNDQVPPPALCADG